MAKIFSELYTTISHFGIHKIKKETYMNKLFGKKIKTKKFSFPKEDWEVKEKIFKGHKLIKIK